MPPVAPSPAVLPAGADGAASFLLSSADARAQGRSGWPTRPCGKSHESQSPSARRSREPPPSGRPTLVGSSPPALVAASVRFSSSPVIAFAPHHAPVCYHEPRRLSRAFRAGPRAGRRLCRQRLASAMTPPNHSGAAIPPCRTSRPGITTERQHPGATAWSWHPSVTTSRSHRVSRSGHHDLAQPPRVKVGPPPAAAAMGLLRCQSLHQPHHAPLSHQRSGPSGSSARVSRRAISATASCSFT